MEIKKNIEGVIFEMAKYNVKPIESLEMEFSDGTVKEAIFTKETLYLFQHEFGDMEELIKTELPIKPYDFMSKVLYSGMKIVDRTVTLDEAKMILIGGGEEIMHEIARLLTDNFMATATEDQKEMFKEKLKETNAKIEKVLLEAAEREKKANG